MAQKDKDKTKTFLGMPMRWEPKNIFKGLWDPNDDQLFPPKYFGVGWTINFHALLRSMGVLKKRNKKDSNDHQ